MSNQVTVHLDSHQVEENEDPRMDVRFKDGGLHIEAWLPEGDTRLRQASVLAQKLAAALEGASQAQDQREGIARPVVTVGGMEALTTRSP